MIRRPPRSTRTDTLFPYTTLFRSNPYIVLVHIGDAKQRQIRIATAQNEPCQTFAKAHDSDGYAFRAKHAARAAGRGWLLFTTVGFVAHWRQQPCFAASFAPIRSEEHTSELQSLMRISYADFCLKNKKNIQSKE